MENLSNNSVEAVASKAGGGVVSINTKSLVEAGAHFGHQTSRWCPAMAQYIYSSRNGVHIIDLPKTVLCWNVARKIVVDVAASGGSILFVGTKKQAQVSIAEEAKRCGAFFVSSRWLGGMLTNFQTIRKSVERMKRSEEVLAEEEKLISQGKSSRYTKKERLVMSREVEKLNRSIGGIRDLHGSPSLVFVVDIKREHIAVTEATKLGVPIIALVDTNCDPRQVSYPIPANDDGSRTLKLFCRAVADAVIEGKSKIIQQQVARAVSRRMHKDSHKDSQKDDAAKAKETEVQPIVD